MSVFFSMKTIYRLRHFGATASAARSAFFRSHASTAAISNGPQAIRSKSSVAAAGKEGNLLDSIPTIAKPEEEMAMKTPVPKTATSENDDEQSGQMDSTYSNDKSGTPSPWAVFDAWGAGAGVVPDLPPEMEALLDASSVKIPITTKQRHGLATETEILRAYEQLLKRKSSVHFGYPYNLMYDHAELYDFMKVSHVLLLLGRCDSPLE